MYMFMNVIHPKCTTVLVVFSTTDIFVFVRPGNDLHCNRIDRSSQYNTIRATRNHSFLEFQSLYCTSIRNRLLDSTRLILWVRFIIGSFFSRSCFPPRDSTRWQTFLFVLAAPNCLRNWVSICVSCRVVSCRSEVISLIISSIKILAAPHERLTGA